MQIVQCVFSRYELCFTIPKVVLRVFSFLDKHFTKAFIHFWVTYSIRGLLISSLDFLPTVISFLISYCSVLSIVASTLCFYDLFTRWLLPILIDLKKHWAITAFCYSISFFVLVHWWFMSKRTYSSMFENCWFEDDLYSNGFLISLFLIWRLGPLFSIFAFWA